MAEENQVKNEPQQVKTEPQQVTTKNPKKVEAGKRLAEHNHRKREEQTQAQSEAKSRVNQYDSIGAVMAVRVIGGLGYYIYITNKSSHPHQNNPPHQPCPSGDNSHRLGYGMCHFLRVHFQLENKFLGLFYSL